MAEIVDITDGFEIGSTAVEVYGDYPDGTPVVLYQQNDLLGTTTLLNKKGIVTTAPLVDTGFTLEAYPNERLGRSRPLTLADAEPTGWVIPNSVTYNGTTMTYLAWQALVITNPEQFHEIADLFKPQLTINRNPDKDSLDKLAHGKLLFDTDKTFKDGQVIVTIATVQNAYGGYVVQFDGGVIGTTASKTYTVSGTYVVKVIDLADSANFKEETFTITIPNYTVPTATTIVQLSYRAGHGDNGSGDFDAGYAFADCPQQVEFRLQGATPSGWVDGEGGQYNQWTRIFGNVPSGTNTLEARVKANVSDTKNQTFTQ